MKAFLLAAGIGTRLRPLTDKTPKCLLPVGGRALLEIWLAKCEKFGIKEVLINGHYLAKQVEQYLNANKDKLKLKMNYVFEKKLKGTGGTIRDNLWFVKNEQCFFIFHADVFCEIDLKDFQKFHSQRKSLLTLALCRTKNPQHSGVIEGIKKNGLITQFREKPTDPQSNLASAALFIASPKIKDDFPKKGSFDFSQELLPKYVGRMYGYCLKGYHVNVGTPEKYALANQIAANLKLKAPERERQNKQ